MSFPKIFVFISVIIFGSIFVASYFKKDNVEAPHTSMELAFEPIEIDISNETLETRDNPVQEVKLDVMEDTIHSIEEGKNEVVQVNGQDLPEADRIAEFFNKREPRLPIVQTITYNSRVPWQKGKPAWISDYSSHYKTSRHFIARSLNGSPEYEKQEVKNGDRFNVFREDKNFEFYLLIDLLTSKMWFYFVDLDTNERTLLKTYSVGIGRADANAASGYLTPTGKYALGDKVAVYRPKTKGFYQGEKVEMVRVFGTRWIPFGDEISNCTEPGKGYGIHGLPLQVNTQGELVENLDTLGKYESDGCIRMATKDIEELFSIIITMPTTVELVKGFHQAKPPGTEVVYKKN